MFGQRPEGFEEVMEAPTPKPVALTPISRRTIFAEYVARPPDLTVHISRLGNWHWHNADAQIIWSQFISGLRLQGFENRLTVEFIPEAYGWCVTISQVAAVRAPKHEIIETIICNIEEGIEARKGSKNA